MVKQRKVNKLREIIGKKNNVKTTTDKAQCYQWMIIGQDKYIKVKTCILSQLLSYQQLLELLILHKKDLVMKLNNMKSFQRYIIYYK